MDHVWDLLRRFGNRALGDTCKRVGADIPRKLAKSDRLTGAALNAEAEGIAPTFITGGIAAALCPYMRENSDAKDAAAALAELTSLDPASSIAQGAMTFYSMFKDGASLAEVIGKADSLKKQAAGMII